MHACHKGVKMKIEEMKIIENLDKEYTSFEWPLRSIRDKAWISMLTEVINNMAVWVHEFSEIAVFEVLPRKLWERQIVLHLRYLVEERSVPHIMVSLHTISMVGKDFISPEEFWKEITRFNGEEKRLENEVRHQNLQGTSPLSFA